MKDQRNSGGAGGDRPEGPPPITLQKQAIREALVHARVHLERAEQAAKYAQTMEAKITNRPISERHTFEKEAKAGRQGITMEHDRAIACITQMLSKQTGQTVRAIEEQAAAPPWTVWAGKVTTVGSLNDLVPPEHEDYDRIVFVDGDDREAVEGYTDAEPGEYGSFLVLVGDGEYDAVWGMEGIVPGLHKGLDRLEVN